MMDKQIKRRKNEHIFFSMPKMVLSHGVMMILVYFRQNPEIRGFRGCLIFELLPVV